MTAVQIVLTILAALAVVTAAEIYRELHTFKVTKYSIKSEKFPAGGKTVKIVFLSDLHNRESEGKMRTCIRLFGRNGRI